ncbi:hypothetical protein D3C80_164530 [compost metagenome]
MARCYRCGAKATSREHYPPKSLFPRNSKLQLKTVPSCHLHNSARSDDDQYFLAHVAINCSREGNLARNVFMDKVLPQIRQSGGYAALLINGSTTLGDGSRAYRVDVSRIDRVLDSICHATFYAHFRTRFDDNKHVMHHRYPNFTSADVEANTLSTSAQGFIEQFSQLHPGMSQPHSLEVNDQPVYSCNVVAPVGKEGSITIHHTFFGIFNVVSFLTRQWDADIAEVLQQAASVVLGQRGK